jgi:hypothetical protein
LGLLQGLDENGNFQSGFAMDLNPYMLKLGDTLTLNNYRSKNQFELIPVRAQISTGVSKGSSDNDKSARAAIGLRTSLFDYGDPRKDNVLLACIAEAQSGAMKKHPEFLPNPKDSDIVVANKTSMLEKAIEEDAKKCRSDFLNNNRQSRPALDVGISPLWISPDGETKNFDWSGMHFWASFRSGITEKFNVIINARYKLKTLDPDQRRPGSFIKGDTFSTGLKLRYGTEKYGILGQGVYSNYSPDGGKTEDQLLYSIGGEVKLADNLWLELTLGGTSGKEANNSGFITSQFKWAFAESSVLK